MTGCSVKRAQRALSSKTINLVPGRELGAAKYAEGLTGKDRNVLTEAELWVYTTFFLRSTHQCSGANVDHARIMDKEYYVWEADLYAEWPGLLRELGQRRPDLVPDLDRMPTTGWTKFQANFLAAVHGCPDDTALECKKRKKHMLDKYCRGLAVKTGRLPAPTADQKTADDTHRRAQTLARLDQDLFSPYTHDVTAPTMPTFRAWLASTEHTYTRNSVPHPCPLCQDGPVDELVHASIQAEIVAHENNGTQVPPETTQKSVALRKKLRTYRVHLNHLEHCRVQAKKAEDDLTPGTAMVIRDFVNHHDHDGRHVKCLIWVLMWRDVEGGPILKLKLRHYCSDKNSMSTDSYYQADVTDFHLRELEKDCPKIMEKCHTLIFVGDHGPHFASHETMFNESTCRRRYGKKIILMFLASYHAYSRADGAGAEDSTNLRKDGLNGFPRRGARAMTNMTNASNDGTSWAYEFPAICRNQDVFPPGKHFQSKTRAKWIKKWTEVKFDHPDESGAYDGILQYRLVTGQGE
jgi:hypothetical protein